MNWINENSGVVILITAIILIVMLGIALWLLFYVKGKIAVNRLTFLGFYSIHLDKRESYAEFTIGNKSLNDVGISEIGLKNGGVSFNLTGLYREKKQMNADAKIVVEQRASISFRLSSEELMLTAVDGRDGKKLVKTLRIYAVDFAGNLYQGRLRAVRKLLKNLVNGEAGKINPAARPAVLPHTELQKTDPAPLPHTELQKVVPAAAPEGAVSEAADGVLEEGEKQSEPLEEF